MVALVATLVVSPFIAVTKPASANETRYHRMAFPVEGGANYSDDFGAPRSGGRTHQGNDLMAPKMRRVLSTFDGRITLRPAAGVLSGNMITVTADDGWSSWYMHINNDTPGTDDGVNDLQYAFAPGLTTGDRVSAGQFIGYVGDSGDAETTASHVHFELHMPGGTAIDPWTSVRLSQGLRAGDRCTFDSNPAPTSISSAAAAKSGYWALGSDGGVFSFGSAPFLGSTGSMRLTRPVVGMAAAPKGTGYWLVASDGGIFSFGDAAFFGSTGSTRLNQPIVDMASTPSGKGYWMVASDGGIFSFGDAAFFGSTGSIRLNQPIVAMRATPSGKGYWLLAKDGGLFTFGDASFMGSLAGAGVHSAAKALITSPSGKGYTILADDGGVFTFGDAGFRGSLPGTGLCTVPKGVDFETTASGKGYWVQGADGSVWAFGDAAYRGSLSDMNMHPNLIAFTAMPAN